MKTRLLETYMKGRSLIAGTALLVLSTELAIAQRPSPAPAPTPKTSITPRAGEECVTTDAGRIECRRILEDKLGRARTLYRTRLDSALMKRAALGLSIGSTGTRRDTIGVFVSAVTPKGPAENAGIIEGDRIVSINGVDLRLSSADVEDNYASELASRRMQREVAKLAPGARVNLRVWSGGRVRDVQVTAGRASDLTRARTYIGGNFPGGAYIFRDGYPELMEMPPMPPMAAMPEMPPMAPMPAMPALPAMPDYPKMAPMPAMPREYWKVLPRLKKELELLPRTKIEPGDGWRLLTPSVAPRRTIRI